MKKIYIMPQINMFALTQRSLLMASVPQVSVFDGPTDEEVETVNVLSRKHQDLWEEDEEELINN